MAPDTDEVVPLPGLVPEEEQQVGEEGHVVARRRPDGPRIDEVGDPVPHDQ
jgi:hypothetical protein